MIKIVFCGFGKLGRDCMKAIIEKGCQIDFVMTHKENDIDSVDTFAQGEGIEFTYKDARKNLEYIIQKLKKVKPVFLISVNYRYIIPKKVYGSANYAINVHGSLLPKYRGRTPHVWSIINGEKETGITSHLIEESVDTGDIISQFNIPIKDTDTGYSLIKKFEKYYPSIVIESIEKLLNKVKPVKQDNSLASYYGKRTPDMGYIDFRKSADEVVNFVRAQAQPYPGAYYYLIDGRKIIINEIIISKFDDLDFTIGVIKKNNHEYFVRCKNKVLKIENYNIKN